MKKSKKIVTEEFLEEKLLDLREGIIDQVDTKNRQYRDDIMTGLDRVMKELETMREENTVGDYQVTEKFDNHEQRIAKLESTTQ